MPKRSKAQFPISREARLYCPTHKTLQKIAFVTSKESTDVAVLECQCARTRYVEPAGVSTEHASTTDGIRLFKADKRLAYQPSGKLNNRSRV